MTAAALTVLVLVAALEAVVIWAMREELTALQQEVNRTYDHLTDEIRGRIVREGRFKC